jgi:AcrR family transcriptional regulator
MPVKTVNDIATAKGQRPHAAGGRRAQIGRAKRARTRNELVNAAFNVFAEKGFDAPVVADFITASGVSRGTFYNYFQTREEILAAVADQLAREINARILPVLTGLRDPAERVAATLRCFIGIAASDHIRAAILVRMIPILGGPLNEQSHALSLHAARYPRPSGGCERNQFVTGLKLGDILIPF